MNKINIKNRKKNRLDAFHYNNWYFFVTINVNNHQKVFGDVVGEEMVLNKYGEIVLESICNLRNHYKNCSIWKYIIMPNHIHMIIIIDNVGNGLKPFLTKWHWLSEIMRGLKTFSSLKIHKSWLQSFKRQKSFYDHIIRNENDMGRIIEYIELNPYAWENDEYYR